MIFSRPFCVFLSVFVLYFRCDSQPFKQNHDIRGTNLLSIRWQTARTTIGGAAAQSKNGFWIRGWQRTASNCTFCYRRWTKCGQSEYHRNPIYARCKRTTNKTYFMRAFQLEPGDRILAVNGEDVKEAPRDHVIQLVRSCETQVNLLVCQPAMTSCPGRKSTLLSAGKRAKLRTRPSRVRFAESVCVNGAPLFPVSTHSPGWPSDSLYIFTFRTSGMEFRGSKYCIYSSNSSTNARELGRLARVGKSAYEIVKFFFYSPSLPRMYLFLEFLFHPFPFIAAQCEWWFLISGPFIQNAECSPCALLQLLNILYKWPSHLAAQKRSVCFHPHPPIPHPWNANLGLLLFSVSETMTYEFKWWKCTWICFWNG